MSSKIAKVVHFHVFIVLLCSRISHSGRIKRIVGGTPVTCGLQVPYPAPSGVSYHFVVSCHQRGESLAHPLCNACLFSSHDIFGIQPRAASLVNATSGEHLCGAIIVTPEYALTAAHCVGSPADQYRLQLRNYCVAEDEAYPEARVDDVITHEEYNRYTRAHDLSILKITLGLDDVAWLNDPVLPASSFGLSSENCVIYGYGSTDPSSVSVSDALLAGRVKTMSLDECVERLGPYVAPDWDSGLMCAIGDVADACQGDSGGPLICEGVLQGVSSYGQSCGVEGLPGVYASIGPHLRWINDVITRSRPVETNSSK